MSRREQGNSYELDGDSTRGLVMEGLRAAYRNFRMAHPDSKFEGWFSLRRDARYRIRSRRSLFIILRLTWCSAEMPAPNPTPLYTCLLQRNVRHTSDGWLSTPTWRIRKGEDYALIPLRPAT
jgi:hypothetical protein